MATGHKPCGGIASRQHVETRVRTGSGSHSTRPAGVNMIGNVQGDHVTNKGSTGDTRASACTIPSATFNPCPLVIPLPSTWGKVGAERDALSMAKQGLRERTEQQIPAVRVLIVSATPSKTSNRRNKWSK